MTALAEVTRNAFLGPQWVDRSEAIDVILPAYALALAEVEDLIAAEEANIEGKNGGRSYSYRYADLPQTVGYLREFLAGHGLAVSTVPTTDGNALAIFVTLIHAESAQWLTFAPLKMPAAGGAQAIGSAITYARRYALTAIMGMAVEDDDGSQATEAVRRTERSERRGRSESNGGGGAGATRAATSGDNRTPEERTIRAMLSSIRDEEGRKRAQEEFRKRFSATLAGLTPDRHAEALTWMRAYMQNGQRPPEENPDQADAEWVQEALSPSEDDESERRAALAQRKLAEAGIGSEVEDDPDDNPHD